MSLNEHLPADADWWRQAVIYQIYPRSFSDSNGDGIGDLPGITAQVPYLAALGIDAVWLSPFYPSALADGGYDVDDYRDVDPKLGTLEDFDTMLTALHAAGIRAFVDIVPNHSSNLHHWFQEALRSEPGSPARDRYIFRDGKGENGELPPNDWHSHFAPSAWTRTTNPDGTPGQWYLHLFAPEQPDLNWEHPDIPEDFIKTLRFWADRGVDGFRIDVAHAMKKDLTEPYKPAAPYSRDHLPLDGSHPLLDRDEVHDIYKTWRTVFNEYTPPRVAVAEANVAAERRTAYASPDELGQAFNFDLLGANWNAAEYQHIIDYNIRLAEAAGSSSTWVLSNHDRVRHVTRYGLPQRDDMRAWLNTWLLTDGTTPPVDVPLGIARARAATLLTLALPGCTYFYQGEELALPEVTDLPADALQDPIWIRSNGTRKGRDGCRVPLPWTTEQPSYGFSTHAGHLPQPDWFANHAVTVQEADPDSTLTMYREAINLRKTLQTFEHIEWVDSREHTLHFRRPTGWHCFTNFGPTPVELPEGEILISSQPIPAGRTLPPNTTIWYRA